MCTTASSAAARRSDSALRWQNETRRMKIAAALLALLAAAATLAGCGTQSVLDPVAAAATKTQNAGGAKISMRLTVDAPVIGSTVVTAEGAFDQKQGELTLDLSDLVAKLPAQLPVGDGQIRTIYTNESG